MKTMNVKHSLKSLKLCHKYELDINVDNSENIQEFSRLKDSKNNIIQNPRFLSSFLNEKNKIIGQSPGRHCAIIM